MFCNANTYAENSGPHILIDQTDTHVLSVVCVMYSGHGRPMPPRNHEGGGPHPAMGALLPPNPQQPMGPMGMGMYPGVVPYGVVPGMHLQVSATLCHTAQAQILQAFQLPPCLAGMCMYHEACLTA